MDDIRNSGDVTRIAMGFVPVNDMEDLVNKLHPYKEASPKLLSEIIRAVNVENQYHRLNESKFVLSKAASLMGKPFHVQEVLRALDKGSVGELKAASVNVFSFKQLSALRKVAARRKVASAAVASEKDIAGFIRGLKNRKDDAAYEKMAVLKDLARTRKAAILNNMKGVADEIARIVGRDPRIGRKYAELDAYRTEPIHRHRKLRVTDIVKWADLQKRMIDMDAELRLVNLTLGEDGDA